MASGSKKDLERIDRALMQLRRFVEAPAMVDDRGRHVETSTLLVLEALGPESEPTVRDVARRLDVTHSTASRLVTRAEQAGMVRRRRSPTNRRETLVEATDDGHALRDRARTFRLHRLCDIVADWRSDDVAAFAHSLASFAERAAQESRVPDHHGQPEVDSPFT
ncbi:MarR family winged helix-turn-helix transcriptional regulator [Cellulomonas fimi]|uniref:Winged helix-turn-helix transcriptional regulator n=1 Tax=Cellulomonas fimi TaxID=1708 RepID=A0A7Y0LXX6_CELFI|nr:MarR family winged helix-turn-helix transcriptional regulator [Cellulomonas fimi]NMR20110.1 winged helix-turn-helix transcriptional regulator [Cellulomonas fimi]